MSIMLFLCDKVPELTTVESEFTPQLGQDFFKRDTLFLFNPERGYTLNLAGTRARSYGEDASSTVTDSLFMKISTKEGIIPTINGATLGKASFQRGDIFNWHQLIQAMQVGVDLPAIIIQGYMDSASYASIIQHDSAQYLTPEDSNAIIKAYSDVIEDNNFYSTWGETIRDLIFDDTLLMKLHNEVAYMIDKGIFFDSAGTLTGSLTQQKLEVLRWFNWRMLVNFAGHQTQTQKIFTKHPSAKRVFTILFETGTSRSAMDETITERYISYNSKIMTQVAASEKDTLFLYDKFTKIHDYDMTTRNPYLVTPLISPTDIPDISISEFKKLLLPGDAFFTLVRYSAAGDTLYYNLKLFYVLSGTIIRNGNPIDITGSITTKIDFIKLPWNVEYLDQGYIEQWNTEIHIWKRTSTGKTIAFSEKRMLQAEYNNQSNYSD